MINDIQWYIRKYICRNGVEERTKFPVRSSSNQKREREREVRRSDRRADTSEHEVARLLNNNFDAGSDYHLVLEYSEEGMAKLMKRVARIDDGISSLEDMVFRAGQQEFVNWVRRVQRMLGGAESFKYLGVTSDMDGDTGEAVRLHHHVVVNKEALSACQEKWTDGFVLKQELFNVNGDLSALASYMIRQVRYILNNKRYVPSRNLISAETTKPRLVTRGGESEMRVPAGCVELYRSSYSRGYSQYLRYWVPPEKRKKTESA